MISSALIAAPSRFYFDRNVKKVSIIDAQASVAPHAETSRGAYTVPTARKAVIESAFGASQQITAQTTAGNVNLQARVVQVDVGEAFGPKVFEAVKFNLALGSQAQNPCASVGWVLKAGDVCTFYDSDQGVGGTVAYDGSISFAEFDA